MEAEIKRRIHKIYPDATIDIAGEACNFEVFVVSELFKDMKTLQRQKSILALFKNDLESGAMHALTIKAKTPEEQRSAGGLVQINL
ncbi:MAG: BolA/IbaG family iron-sulfur metabolism protein [Gammaproteobacteria bacterium]|nr:BolA/IbaG family iron-sulfur metabolism protein [Gammaproteobacteria bacterium]